VNAYTVGSVVRLTGTFTNSSGTPVDPTMVGVKVKNPAGTTATKLYGTDVEVTRSAAGVYYLDQDVDTAGDWYYRWYSTGTGKAADEDVFMVMETEV
jgi:hypothetical protein